MAAETIINAARVPIFTNRANSVIGRNAAIIRCNNIHNYNPICRCFKILMQFRKKSKHV